MSWVPIQHHDSLAFQSSLLERDNLQTEEIWKPFYSSVAQHSLLAAEEANQSKEEPEIVINEDENRKIAAEALKKVDEVQNGSDHLNMIFNKLSEKVEQMKLKNQKQSNIRSFFRS